MSIASLWWSLLFGSIGAGLLLYGRRQRALVPLLCGFALIVLPCLVRQALALAVTGSVLVALPFFVRR